MRHTRGPWVCDVRRGYDRIVGPSDECIAETGRWKEQHAEEMHANARLIAAAPAMWEALEAFIGIYPSKSRNHPDVSMAIARAEAVLAQVEGREP